MPYVSSLAISNMHDTRANYMINVIKINTSHDESQSIPLMQLQNEQMAFNLLQISAIDH